MFGDNRPINSEREIDPNSMLGTFRKTHRSNKARSYGGRMLFILYFSLVYVIIIVIIIILF